MQVEELHITEITPYESNPRNNDNAVDAVAASIKEFGFQQPIVVDSDGIIIVGHTRYKAAQQLGLEFVPVVVADNLTPEQAAAYRLADNKVGELAGWDYSLLEMELAGIENIDMSDFGFIDTEEIDLDSFFEDAPEKQPEDDEPEMIMCPHCGESFEK